MSIVRYRLIQERENHIIGIIVHPRNDSPLVNKEPLLPKQQRFVEEYVIDWNGAQAAIRAGYSESSAKVTASRLLTNANVKEAIYELKLRIRTDCYNAAVDATIRDRMFLAGVAAMRDQSSESSERESIGCLPDGVNTVHSETEDTEVIEFQFPNRLAAIDRLNKLIDAY